MNKAILINAAWVAVAVTAFAIGRTTSKPGADASSGTEATNQRTGLSALAVTENVKLPKPAAPADSEAEFISRFLEGGAGIISKERMAEAMREALAETDPVKRALMMAQLMQNLSPENVQAALAALRESPDRRENFQYMALLQYAWGQIDGPAAIAAAQEAGDGGRGGAFGAMSALAGWASADPEAAKQWIEGIEDGREKMVYMNGLIEGLAKSDPAAATAYVLGMAAPEAGEDGVRGGFDMRSRYIANIASEMLKQGFDVASAWANGLPEGSLRASALGEVAQFYARQDPATAARWIESYAGSADANSAVREIADRWSRESPADAARWLAGLPSDSQGEAMRSVFDEWAKTEPVEASEYLATLAPSSGRDSAVSGFARELAGNDPGAAIEWASSIADEELRQRTELSVARQWYRDQPEEAQAWAQQNLPAESQEAITERERGERGDFGGGGGFDRGGGFGGGGGGRGRGR